MRKGVALNEKQNRRRTRKEKEREREREKHGALLLLWRTSAGAMRPRDNAMIGYPWQYPHHHQSASNPRRRYHELAAAWAAGDARILSRSHHRTLAIPGGRNLGYRHESRLEAYAVLGIGSDRSTPAPKPSPHPGGADGSSPQGGSPACARVLLELERGQHHDLGGFVERLAVAAVVATSPHAQRACFACRNPSLRWLAVPPAAVTAGGGGGGVAALLPAVCAAWGASHGCHCCS